jgi:RNA polymerase sigma-70 factor (ECF subfamily)
VDAADLARACAAGDADAWRRFVAEYHPWLSFVARRSLPGAAAEADDVVAEVLTKLLENDRALLKKFRAPFNLKAWLAVIVRRTARRHQERRRPGGPPVEEPEAPAAASFTLLETLLAELPADDRLILQLFYGEEAGYEEISAILGIPVNTIGKRKFRAIELLRRIARGKNLKIMPDSGTPGGIPLAEQS